MTAPGPDATASTTVKGRGRRCFGPLGQQTQTEDPLSIACLPVMFEGDNSGATSRGVTATEIRVAIPAWSSFAGDGVQMPMLKAFFDYVNSRYELYGRRLVPVVVGGSAGDAVSNRALAASVVAAEPFASITGPIEWGGNLTPGFAQTLARGGVVTVARSASWWWSDQTVYDPFHPYLWSVYPSAEDVQANLGDFACRTLAGHAAQHTDDPTLKGSPRRFGIIATAAYVVPSSAVLARRLADCTGVDPVRLEWSDSAGSDALRIGMTRFKEAGVTTVLCVCEAYRIYNAMSPAKSLGFRPEWVLVPSANMTGNDENPVQSDRRSNLYAPPIRLSAGPKLIPVQARPWYGAIAATDPTVFNSTDKYRFFGMGEFLYDQLQVLASGIQAAGPTLTPDTFAQGLMTAQFPNPGAGAPGSWQPAVGFGPGDHSFYDDYTVGWWSDTAAALDYPASQYSQGSWCYLGAGERFRPGTYPSNGDQLLFNPDVPCR